MVPPPRPPDPWVTVYRGDTPPAGRIFKVKHVFCFKLDAKSVPEALATTILILLEFSIVLVHPWVSRDIGPPHPSGTPHRHPWAPPGHPPMGDTPQRVPPPIFWSHTKKY